MYWIQINGVLALVVVVVLVVTPLLGPGIHTWCCCCNCFARAARPCVPIHNPIQPHAPGLLLGALGPAGRPPPETARYPGPAGCMAMHWRAPGIRRSQMRRRYEGAHRPVQRPPWVIRRASCGVAVQPWCDAGPDRDRAPGPGRARAAAALRASGASNGPREGPSVYCTGALWKALA